MEYVWSEVAIVWSCNNLKEVESSSSNYQIRHEHIDKTPVTQTVIYFMNEWIPIKLNEFIAMLSGIFVCFALVTWFFIQTSSS